MNDEFPIGKDVNAKIIANMTAILFNNCFNLISPHKNGHKGLSEYQCMKQQAPWSK